MFHITLHRVSCVMLPLASEMKLARANAFKARHDEFIDAIIVNPQLIDEDNKRNFVTVGTQPDWPF